MWSSIFCSGRKSTCFVDIWGVDKAICIFHDDTMLLLPITSQSESELSLGIAKGNYFYYYVLCSEAHTYVVHFYVFLEILLLYLLSQHGDLHSFCCIVKHLICHHAILNEED